MKKITIALLASLSIAVVANFSAFLLTLYGLSTGNFMEANPLSYFKFLHSGYAVSYLSGMPLLIGVPLMFYGIRQYENGFFAYIGMIAWPIVMIGDLTWDLLLMGSFGFL